MTDYEDMESLRGHIDSEGLEYFFVHYTSAESITVGGQPLPDYIITEAANLAHSVKVLGKFFS